VRIYRPQRSGVMRPRGSLFKDSRGLDRHHLTAPKPVTKAAVSPARKAIAAMKLLG
jgi:hypothetical protein